MGIVIDEDSVGRSLEVLELSAPECPEEGGKPEQAHSQGNRKKNGDARQRACPIRVARTSRSELAMTTSELVDMATAASSGVK